MVNEFNYINGIEKNKGQKTKRASIYLFAYLTIEKPKSKEISDVINTSFSVHLINKQTSNVKSISEKKIYLLHMYVQKNS